VRLRRSVIRRHKNIYAGKRKDISAFGMRLQQHSNMPSCVCMILAVLNQKGGTGKTTMAIHVGMAWVRAGARVLLIDADPQGSALDWSEARKETEPALPVLGLPKPTIHREVPALAESYDHVIIDGPPQTEAIVKSAMMAANVVLIPVQPSGVDVWGARPIVALVADALVVHPELKAVFAVNRKASKTFLSRAVLDALAGYRMPVLASALGQRVLFAETVGSGQTVFDADPGGIASTEAMALAKEVLDYAEKATDRPTA
jgi:chromosome partitioning protein